MSLPRQVLFVCFVLSLALIASASRAQLPPTGATTSTPVPGAGHDYLGAPAESVNPANGAVSIRIPVIMPPGRGITLPFSFAYDSNGVNYLSSKSGLTTEWFATNSVISQGGWSNTAPIMSAALIQWTTLVDGGPRQITCEAVVDYVFQDAKGNRHNLGLTSYSDPLGTGQCSINQNDWPQGFEGQLVYQGGEGSLLATTPSGWANGASAVTVTDGDGTVYNFNAHSVGPMLAGSPSSTWMGGVTDRYGNYYGGSGTPPAFNLVDTTGRTVLQDSGFAITPETVTVSGLGAPYTLTWTTLATPTFTTPVTSPVVSGNVACGAPTHYAWSTINNNDHVVSSLTLPNGKSFSFAYDTTYGQVNKITYPTGGYVRYVWGMNAQAAAATFMTTNGQSYYTCSMYYGVPAITDRYVSFDGTTEALHQHFTYTTTWPGGDLSWSSKQTTVTTYDQVRNTSFQTVYSYSSSGYPNPPNTYPILPEQIPVESNVLYYDTTGSLLKTVSKTWGNERILVAEETAYPNGQSSLAVHCYTSSEEPTETDEYDFGTTNPALPTCNAGVPPGATYGSLVRRTVTNYAPNTAMTTAHVIDKPSSIVFYNGSGNRAAETDYTYDSPVGTVTSGIVGHTTGCNCGSLTQQSQWMNSSGTTLNTTFTNDDTGQRLSMKDPNGNQTTYSYTDSYSSGAPSGPTNAYLTTLTLPSTANAAHVEKFSYAYASGEVTSSTDQNNLVTSYKYVDNLARLTETDSPDGGVTSIAYNDAVYNPSTPSPSVTTTKKINSSTSVISVKAFDGIGHTTRTELTSDPQGAIYLDTVYDGLGRVYTVSNPYRSGTDPTTSSGTTTYIYDGLGRKCVEVPADGTAVTGNACPAAAPAKDLFTQYSGTTTTVTDETGKKRQSTTDGLGRLITVVEDPGGAGYTTNYTNDALGNLTQVVQNGSHSRTFTYDFLSRLLTSNNPEVGTITYKYDSDTSCSGSNSFLGLLVSKTDARGIRACAQYDQLNREIVHNYSNGDATITTTYDQPACIVLPACQNIGHATSITDGAGSEVWAYQTDPSNLRSAHANRRTTTSSPSNITKTSTYYFDLASNLTSITYPTGRIVNYTYDGANRPATAVDSSNGITYAAAQSTPPSGCLSSGVCYTPQGSEYSAAIGKTSTFTGLNIAETYNTRLQPLEIKASSSAGNASDINYSFVDPTSGGNAGHVNTITNNLNSARSQSFAYDHLNRIVTAGTTATTGTYCWGYQYTYDAWANLTSQAGWSPNYNGCSEATMGSVTVDGNNHIYGSGFAYDASGNTQSDGTIAYTYDAESQIKTAAGVNYLYDGSGRRVSKSNGKLYWYGSGGEILAETDASGNTLNEYIFFGGKRIALISASGGTALPVQNASFEIANAWTTNCGTNCNYNGGPVPDWTFSGSGTQGSFEPNSSYFNLPLPDGSVLAYLNAGSYTQTLTGVTFLPNTTYTLSVYLGHRLDGYATNYTVALQAGSTLLNSVSGSSSTITAGDFAQVTVTYTTGSTPPSGYVTIVLTSAGSQSDFDKVTLAASGGIYYYVEDMLGTSRVITQANGTVCYDADFDPFGGEHPYTDNCPQGYKFEGKERDTETGNDDFGARYYSNRFGRWLSADWSNVPVAVPYANLTNPQTLNLYAMVADDPESFADLDGHNSSQSFNSCGIAAEFSCAGATNDAAPQTVLWSNQQGNIVAVNQLSAAQQQAQNQPAEQQSNRQPDGSYKATPAQLAEIRERNEHRKDKDGNPIMITAPNDPDGQCVTACEHFTGVPGPTSSWRAGRNASDLTDADVGLAIATFVGSGSKARYPTDGNQNSAVFMGKGIGGIWVADQWPNGKPTTIYFMPTHNFRDPDTRSANAETYRVIIVSKP